MRLSKTGSRLLATALPLEMSGSSHAFDDVGLLTFCTENILFLRTHYLYLLLSFIVLVGVLLSLSHSSRISMEDN